jgi:hypothetical protein
MKEKILAKLQEFRAEENDSLAAMDFAADRSVELMKAYCHCKELPEELRGVGVSLAGMILNSGSMASGQVKSVREGDVSVTFAENADGRDTSDLLGCFQTELDRYRRMDW